MEKIEEVKYIDRVGGCSERNQNRRLLDMKMNENWIGHIMTLLTTVLDGIVKGENAKRKEEIKGYKRITKKGWDNRSSWSLPVVLRRSVFTTSSHAQTTREQTTDTSLYGTIIVVRGLSLAIVISFIRFIIHSRWLCTAYPCRT